MQIVAPCVCPELSILAATVPAGHPPEQSVWLKRDYGGEEGGRKGQSRVCVYMCLCNEINYYPWKYQFSVNVMTLKCAR